MDLALEALQDCRMADEIEADHLQRHVAVELAVAREIHLPHPTLAEPLHDVIALAEVAAFGDAARKTLGALAGRSAGHRRLHQLEGRALTAACPSGSDIHIREVLPARSAGRGMLQIFRTASRTSHGIDRTHLGLYSKHPGADAHGDDCRDQIADKRGWNRVTCPLHADGPEVDSENVESRFRPAVDRRCGAADEGIGAELLDDVRG